MDRTVGGTADRSPLDKVQPSSLAGSVLFSTPISAKSMRVAGRGRGADEGTVYTGAGGKVRALRCELLGIGAIGKAGGSKGLDLPLRFRSQVLTAVHEKRCNPIVTTNSPDHPHLQIQPPLQQEAFESAIDAVRRKTVEEVQRWSNADGGPSSATAAAAAAGATATSPVDDTQRHDQPTRLTPTHSPAKSGLITPTRPSQRTSGVGSSTPGGSAARAAGGSAGSTAGAQVEARILAKVVAVVSPLPPSSIRTLARRAVTNRPDAAIQGVVDVTGGNSSDPPVGAAGAEQQTAGGTAMLGGGAVRKSMGVAGSRPAVVGAGPNSSRRGGVYRG